MAKTKEQKNAMLKQYKDLLSNGRNYFVVDTDRVGMTQITELKKDLKESGATFHVVKNTLFKIAAQETDQPTKLQEIEDATGIVVCEEEPIGPAKALKKLQKAYEILKTKFGVLFGEIAEAEKVDQLADISSREELLAKLVGTMNAPLVGFMSTSRGNARQFVSTLSEIQKTRSE
ncbi:50S ribosomal protein L10 [Candidatus Dojkabacteria bacterium]|nr:50S ribosomal protein L10 [Candidatus Dojkabacteria bacterium]